MGFGSRLKRWKEPISVCIVFLVWVLLVFDNHGHSTPDTLYEVFLLVMLLFTLVILMYEIWQTASA